MNEEQFWKLIDTAKSNSEEPIDRPESLTKELSVLTASEIIDFDNIYFDQILKAYQWELWGAAYVIYGGCSDDSFRYFCDFLISEGKSTFEKALIDPESLVDVNEIDEVDSEGFGYVAMEVYEEKTDSEIPASNKSYPDNPSGIEWDEDGVEKLYPKLAKIFW